MTSAASSSWRNLFGLRAFAHWCLVLLYLPIAIMRIIVPLAERASPLYQSPIGFVLVLLGLVLLAALLVMDRLTVRRIVHRKSFISFEVVAIAVIMLSAFESQRELLVESSVSVNGIDTAILEEIIFATFLIAIVAFCAITILFYLTLLVIDVIRRRGRFDTPSDSLGLAAIFDVVPGHGAKDFEDPLASGLPLQSSPREKLGTSGLMPLGRHRSVHDRHRVEKRVEAFIYNRTFFRKHSFEPGFLAFLRGAVAVYTTFALFIYIVYSSSQGAYNARSVAKISEAVVMYSDTVFPGPSDILQVILSAGTPQAQGIGTFNVSTSKGARCFVSMPPDTTSAAFVIYNCPDSPMADQLSQTTISITWTNTTVDTDTSESVNANLISIWMITPFEPGSFSGNKAMPGLTPVLQSSPAMTFHPGTTTMLAVDACLVWYGYSAWITYSPSSSENPVVVANPGSQDVSVTITSNFLQSQFRQVNYSPSSLTSTILQVLANLGGILALVDSVYAFVFGRTIMAILSGSRPITPFGIMGVVARSRFRRLIQEHYPLLREECSKGGMSSFLKDVAVDVGFIENIDDEPRPQAGHLLAPLSMEHSASDLSQEW